MKKIFALILICAMSFSVLVSCSQPDAETDITSGSDGEQTKNTEIDLNGYTVIRSENASSEVMSKITELIEGVRAKSGVSLNYTDDFIGRNETEQSDAKEIVIGITDRTASKDALSSIDGSGFTVRLSGQRIIILGTDDTKTCEAIEYFMENHVASLTSSVLLLEQNFCYNSEFEPNIEVLKASKSEFTVIYSDSADSSGSFSSSADDKLDREFEWASEISKTLNKLTGSTSVGLDTDFVKRGTQPDSEKFEILVGDTNRPELSELKENLGYNDYTVRVVGHKIIVFGWNLTTLEYAVEHFISMVYSSAVKSQDDTVDFAVASDYCYTASTDKWLTEFPDFEGGEFSSVHDTNNGALTFIYENTNADAFSAYGEKLIGAGYELYVSNKLGDVVSATYKKDSAMIHTYYVPSQKTVKIITDKEVEFAAQAPQKTEKICDMSLTQMRLAYDAENFGMCYILTLEDGSFIIYDGGGAKGADHTRLYSILKRLNKRPDGKIDIAAWVITHAHWDHYSVFKQFFEVYSVSCEAVIINVPDVNERHNITDSYDTAGDGAIQSVAEKIGARVIVPYTAQSIYIRNVKMDVLFTHEAMLPDSYGCQNNTSTVTRFTVGTQNITFLGDIQAEASTIMTKMYGDALQSDIVQVAHHSSPGATLATYKKIAPKVLLWPVDNTSYESHTNIPEASSYHYRVNYELRYKMNVKEILLADFTNKTIPLPYTPNSGTLVEWE